MEDEVREDETARAQEGQSEEELSEQTPSEQTPLMSSFDEMKDMLSKNLENLRFLWGENKDVLFSLNQVIKAEIYIEFDSLCSIS